MAFIISFKKYKLNVLPFRLKNAPLEFEKIMNEIFINYTKSSSFILTMF